MLFTLFLLFQLIFEGSLDQQTGGFIAISALYFTNGYCSAEPTKAAKKGKYHNIAIIITMLESPYTGGDEFVSPPIYENIYKNKITPAKSSMMNVRPTNQSLPGLA